MTMYCYTCRFYSGNNQVGMCRRFPPISAEWAQVAGDDWCGEHKMITDERRLDAPFASLVDRVTARTYGDK